MKNLNFPTKLSITLCSLTLLLLTSNCSSPSQDVKNSKEDISNAQEALIKAENEVAAEIISFKNKSQQQINDNEVNIAQLKAKIKSNSKSVKDDFRDQLEILEQKNTAMKTRISEYKDNGKENWQAFKTGFSNDMDQLSQSLNDCIADLKI